MKPNIVANNYFDKKNEKKLFRQKTYAVLALLRHCGSQVEIGFFQKQVSDEFILTVRVPKFILTKVILTADMEKIDFEEPNNKITHKLEVASKAN